MLSTETVKSSFVSPLVRFTPFHEDYCSWRKSLAGTGDQFPFWKHETDILKCLSNFFNLIFWAPLLPFCPIWISIWPIIPTMQGELLWTWRTHPVLYGWVLKQASCVDRSMSMHDFATEAVAPSGHFAALVASFCANSLWTQTPFFPLEKAASDKQGCNLKPWNTLNLPLSK